MKRLLEIISTATVIFSVTGCLSIWRRPVPEAEIVFQMEEVNKYPYYRLGFINTNGENNEVINLNKRFSKPVWSIDGNYLYGLSSSEGVYYGYPAFWDLKQGRFGNCSQNLPYFGQIQGLGNPDNPYEVMVQNIDNIKIMDLSRCVELRTLVDYSTKPGNMLIGFSYSYSRQELVYGLVVNPYNDPIYKLMYLDLNIGREVQLAEGINPAWSPDGARVAYVAPDGLYIIAINGVEQTPQKLVDNNFYDPAGSDLISYVTIPSWSPDGEWLVYHWCSTTDICSWEDATIYKISSDGGEKETVMQGGKFPNWRP